MFRQPLQLYFWWFGSAQLKMHLFFVSVLLVFGFPFIMTDVVDSFKTCKEFFFKEKTPEFPGILENSFSKNQNQYRIICQKYKNVYRYATLYDIQNKIPLFSAYKYSGHKGKRPNVPWMIEPQVRLQNPVFFFQLCLRRKKKSLLCLSICLLSVL